MENRYSYDKSGELTGFTRSDGYEEAYTYDAAGNMTGKTERAQDGRVTSSVMEYNGANQMVGMYGKAPMAAKL